MLIAFEIFFPALLLIVLALASDVILRPILKLNDIRVPVIHVSLGSLLLLPTLIATLTEAWRSYASANTRGPAVWLTKLGEQVDGLGHALQHFTYKTQLALAHLTHVTVHEIVKAFVRPVHTLAAHALTVGQDARRYAAQVHSESMSHIRDITKEVYGHINPAISNLRRSVNSAHSLAQSAIDLARTKANTLSSEVATFEATMRSQLSLEHTTLERAIASATSSADQYTSQQVQSLVNAIARGVGTAESDLTQQVGTLSGDVGSVAGNLSDLSSKVGANARQIATVGATIAALVGTKSLVDSHVMPAVRDFEAGKQKYKMTCQTSPQSWEQFISSLLPIVGAFSIAELLQEIVGMAEEFLPGLEELITHG